MFNTTQPESMKAIISMGTSKKIFYYFNRLCIHLQYRLKMNINDEV